MLGLPGVIFAVGVQKLIILYHPVMDQKCSPDSQISKAIQPSKTLNPIPLLLPGKHQPGRFHGRFRLAAGS